MVHFLNTSLTNTEKNNQDVKNISTSLCAFKSAWNIKLLPCIKAIFLLQNLFGMVWNCWWFLKSQKDKTIVYKAFCWKNLLNKRDMLYKIDMLNRYIYIYV